MTFSFILFRFTLFEFLRCFLPHLFFVLLYHITSSSYYTFCYSHCFDDKYINHSFESFFGNLECSRGIRTDVSLVPPIRQTASIFKQPVTVHRNHDSKVKSDLKHGTSQEKPKQLFWEKRLEVKITMDNSIVFFFVIRILSI